MSNENYSETLLSAVTSVSNGTAKQVTPIPAPRHFVCKVVGTGAVSATVAIKAGNNSTDLVSLYTVTLSGTTSALDGVTDMGAWPYLRADVTAISGTNAAVTCTVGG